MTAGTHTGRDRLMTIAYGFLILIVYLILQPKIFGPPTNTFAKGMETHALLTQLLRYANEFSQLGDPVVRMWYGEFDLHHNPHMNVHYPFYFTGIGGYGDLVSSNHRVFLITHFHHFIGGLGAFVFAKAIGARNISAFAAGLFFSLCLSNTYVSPFFTRLAASNWTPWGLAAVWLAASGKAPRLAILIGAPSVAMLAFASSSIPMLFFVVTSAFVGLAALYYGWQEYGRSSAFLRRCIIPSIALVILSLCLALPATLPVMLEQSEYVRWTSEGPITGSYKVPYEATLLQSFSGRDGLTNIFVPITKNFNIGTTFIGPVIALIALAAFFFKGRRVLAGILLGVCVYFIINGMGQTTFLPKVTYQIPLINNVRQLTSHYAIVNFAFIALLAIGFEYLIEYKTKHRKRIIAASIISAVIIAYILKTGEGSLAKVSPIYTWSLFAVPILLVLFTLTKNQKLQSVLLILLAVAIVLPHSGLRTKETIDINRTKFYTVDTHRDAMKSWEKIAELDKNAVVATYLVGDKSKGFHARRITSAATFWGLQPFYAIMSPRPVKSFQYIKKAARTPDSLAERGVQYIISNNPNKKFNPNRFDLIETVGSIDIYKSREPLGRLNQICDLFPRNGTCDMELKITEQHETNTEFTYEIDNQKAQKLVFLGYKNNHWTGYLNGKPLELKWTGDDQITFKVPKGQHNIRFKYADKRQIKLWWIFLAGLLMLAVYMRVMTPRSEDLN